ncbi:RNA polymerase II transcription factor SIII subunit A-domain-containing protein [Infundibulicybe gibba]|nr:RNA polymerase II transcription factor SIII subunit A-domain-containing protein [Infundibulicybe gibba]
MSVDMEIPHRRIPTLVQLCQRVATLHVESITSLGHELSYTLVKPILERCKAEQLVALEQGSPHLQDDTPEIWKNLCSQRYPLEAEKYLFGELQEPESWKDRYFELQEAETKRIEEAGSKLRNQRIEAEERKREREVKFTDRVPPSKRQRSGWSGNVQPKSLFQKTRTEASKIQKNMYNARIIPPMANGKNYRVLSKPPDATPLLPPASASPSVVPLALRQVPPASALPRPSATLPPQSSGRNPIPARPKPLTNPTNSSAIPEPRPIKSSKKDPMAALFVPKHRAYSQRPA